MLGQTQDSPRSVRRPLVRMSDDLAGLFVLGVLVSAAFGGLLAFRHAEDGIARDSKLSASQRRHAAVAGLGIDTRQLDSFRARLRPRQRYSLDVPEGTRFRFFTLGKVVRDYSTFYFLPAIRERSGNPVFHYRFR